MFSPFDEINEEQVSHYRAEPYVSVAGEVQSYAKRRLGYPYVGAITEQAGHIDKSVLGIIPGSVADTYMNNSGDPFMSSTTVQRDCKCLEVEILQCLAKHLNYFENDIKGYVSNGGTESNLAAIWWARDSLVKQQAVSIEEKQQQLAQLKHSLANTDDDASYGRLARKAQQLETDLMQLTKPKLMYSAKAHFSVKKIAQLLDLPTQILAVNDKDEIDVTAFSNTIGEHQKQYPEQAIILIATVGTTETSAIDAIPQLQHILASHYPQHAYAIHADAALLGAALPFLKPFGEIHSIFDYCDSVAISGHKLIGTTSMSGILLAKASLFNQAFAKRNVATHYLGGVKDITISGSRAGWPIIELHFVLRHWGFFTNAQAFNQRLQHSLALASYLQQQLSDVLDDEQAVTRQYFNVVFPQPKGSEALVKRYGLMPIANQRLAACVVMLSDAVNIDRFVEDYRTYC